MTDHITRQEMLEAVGASEVPFRAHLADCARCSEMFDVLASLPVGDDPRLTDAPKQLLAKAKAIMSPGPEGSLQRLFANLAFDSWDMPLPLGVRGQSSLRERRLQFRTDGVTVDLRAEQRSGDWDCIARLSGAEPAEFSIVAGHKAVAPSDTGYFQWSSKQPPSAITLKSATREIVLPELSWDPEG